MAELRTGSDQEIGRLQEIESLLRECESRLALVNDLAKRIKGGQTREVIVRATVEGVAKYFPEFDTSFATADPQGVTAVCTAFRDGTVDTTQRRTEAALPRGYLESLVDRAVVAVPELSVQEPAGPLDDALAAGNVRAYLNVAFSYGNGQVGFLAIHCEEPHEWAEHEKATVRQAADVLAVALDAAADKQQLHESEERFRLLAEHSDINISLVQSQGIVYANPTMQRMTGYSEAELRDIDVLDLVDREQRELAHDWVTRRFSGEPMHAPLELKIIPKDGPGRWIEFRGCTIELGGEPTLLSSGIETTDRRQAEQLLLDSESRLRAVLDQLGDGVCVVADGQLVYMNPALCRLFGYTHREIQGMDPLDFLVESKRDASRAQIQRYLSGAAKPTGQPREFEARRKDGTPISVEGTAREIEYGETDALLISVRDLTTRHRAERAAQEAEAKYRVLVENALVGVYIVQDGRFVYGNPQLSKIFGYSIDEFIALPTLLTPVIDDDRPTVKARFHERLEDGVPSSHYTARVRRKDGRVIHIEVYGSRTELGGRPAIIGTCLDITERTEKDEAIRTSEERFRALFEQAPIGMVITLPDTTFSKVNAAFCAMLGYTEAELTGKSFVEVTHEDDLGGTPESAQRVQDSQAPAMRIHKRYLRKDGTTVHAETTVSPVRDASGTLLRSVAMIEDVTERRELERQLQQVQRLESVGQLAGGVAHNFNNALTAIYGYAELLSLRLETDDPALQDLDQIKRVAEQSANLTRQLLAFSRKEQLQLSAFCLNDVIRGACGMLAPIMGDQVQIAVHLDSSAAHVLGDRGQMEQVLTNLILNARDAMPSGGTVTVETGQTTVDKAFVRSHPEAKPGTYVAMTVTDTGLGIDEETVGRIFEPFFTTKEPGKGVGLGLAMVHGAVKQSGGFITVDSTIGEGTSFAVYLPEHSQFKTQLPGANITTPAKP